jgi:hypothetical protein
MEVLGRMEVAMDVMNAANPSAKRMPLAAITAVQTLWRNAKPRADHAITRPRFSIWSIFWSSTSGPCATFTSAVHRNATQQISFNLVQKGFTVTEALAELVPIGSLLGRTKQYHVKR